MPILENLTLADTSSEDKEKAKGLIFWILKGKKQIAALEEQLAAISPEIIASAQAELVTAKVIKSSVPEEIVG